MIQAKMTYQRILERQDISLEAKARLMNLYLQLNPPNFGDVLTSKLPDFGKFLSNISS
jgi:hypothetical protein